VPRGLSWAELDEGARQCLEILGENANKWEQWTEDNSATVFLSANTCDQRTWNMLSSEERNSAVALGFTECSWNADEFSDVEKVIQELFGSGFAGCVTQGCDRDSLVSAERLALAHPRIYASFGCHPKSAWSYNDDLEKRFLCAMEKCGKKAVAWGEFGLDYSHHYYGKLSENRKCQRKVFVRQLHLALAHGYTMVLHCRAADRDTLRMMRRHVPRDWKVHMHSFRGSVDLLLALLLEWTRVYIGISGLVTMRDSEIENLCSMCPLERMLLETDSPYLPLSGAAYSHPGQIPEIVERVAEIKACSIHNVYHVTRANARVIYGI